MDTPQHTPYHWLQAQGAPELAGVLSDHDVFSLNDLRVWIYLEEAHPDKFPSLISGELKQAFKTRFGAQPDSAALYGGSTFEELDASFSKLAHGGTALKEANLSEGLIHLGQGSSLREIRAVLESLDGAIDGEADQREGAPKKDSEVSFVEYCRFLRFKLGGRNPPSIKEALHKLFKHYDRDGNGSLDLAEVKKLMKSLNLSEFEASSLIESADADRDGQLSFEEVYNAVKDGSDAASGAAWRTLKIWMQLSSGWEFVPKDPAEAAKLKKTPGTKLVTFIRHGQSEGNLAADTTGSCKGWFNPHITPKGIAQSQARGVELKDQKFDLIVISPMQRTLETYQHVIGDGINANVRAVGHPLAREQFSDSDDVGDKPSLIKAAWPKVEWHHFPDSPEVWWYPGPQHKPEDIPSLTVEAQRADNMTSSWEEPWDQVMHRAAAFESWLAQQPEQEICVFSHGGFIEALVGPRMGNAQQCVLRVTGQQK